MTLLAIAAAGGALIIPRPLTPVEKGAVKKVVTADFNDPLSAQFKWYRLANKQGYCGLVNGKNLSGGYVGFRHFLVVFATSNGLIEPYPGAIVDRADGRVAYSQCKSAGYPVDTTP